MACCEFCEPVHRGEIYPNAMGHGKRCRVAFITGVKSDYGSGCMERLQQQADANGQLNWEMHHVDGSVIRAHQHAAGAKRGS